MTINNPIEPIDESVPPDRRSWKEIALEATLLIPNLLKLLSRLMRDQRVPIRRKTFLAAVIVYVVSPIDLIPDFVVGLGKLDDIIVLSIAIDHLMSSVDRDIVLEHWDGSLDALDLVSSIFRWGAELIPGVDKVMPR